MGFGHRLLTSLLFLSLSLAAHAADESFPIKVHRPARVGDIFDVHMVFEQTRTETPLPAPPVPAPAIAPTTAPASVPAATEHSLKADLTCRVEVVDVNLQGHTSVRITVGKCISLKDNKDLILAGKVIGVQSDGIDAYIALRADEEMSEDARTVLQHVYPLAYQLDETSFGSKTPRRPGESWSVDPLSVSQIDSNVLFAIDAQSVQGKVSFPGPEKSGNTTGLRLNVTMAHGGQDRFAKISGEKIEHQDCQTQMSLLYPLDTALPPLELQITTDTTAVVTHRIEGQGQAKEMKSEIKTHTSEKQTIKYVAK